MKFTFSGFVMIKVEVLHDKDGLRISIIDTGVGIKKEDQKNLFKIFSMVESTKKINQSGTGIGLYQANNFAKKLGFSGNKGILLESKLK